MGWWSLLAIVAPLAIVVIRELINLRKEAARRDSIVRIVTIAPSGVRITDRASDGGIIEIVVDQARGPRGNAAHRQGRSAS